MPRSLPVLGFEIANRRRSNWAADEFLTHRTRCQVLI
jgi:hypothetical protein